MPLRDKSQSRPQLGCPSRFASLAFSVSRIAKRRPAVLDSTFPWRMSGFRYHEATAILQARPDTLFFSTYEMTDPFPAFVHPLADFPEIAMREGVTDAYGVFLWFLAGLVGLGPSREGSVPHPMEGLDISSALASERIRLHGSLLPAVASSRQRRAMRGPGACKTRVACAGSPLPERRVRASGWT
jgi:hypothetical protein